MSQNIPEIGRQHACRRGIARRFAGGFVLMLAALAGGFAAAAEWSENRLTNSSFELTGPENLNPVGWSANGWSRRGSTESTNVVGRWMETRQTGPSISQTVELKQGEDYLLTFMSKVGEGTNSDVLGFMELMHSTNRLFTWVISRSPQWNETQLLLPRPTADVRASLGFRKTQGTGSVAVANIQLKALKTRPLRDRLMADFETDLDLVDLTKHGALIERSADYAARGNFSAKITHPSNPSGATPTVEFHMQKQDILGYRAITCDVFNPSDKPIQVTAIASVVSSERTYVTWGPTITLQPGVRTPVDFTVSSMFNWRTRNRLSAREFGRLEPAVNVRGFYIFGPYSKQHDCSVHIDNLWLRAN